MHPILRCQLEQLIGLVPSHTAASGRAALWVIIALNVIARDLPSIFLVRVHLRVRVWVEPLLDIQAQATDLSDQNPESLFSRSRPINVPLTISRRNDLLVDLSRHATDDYRDNLVT